MIAIIVRNELRMFENANEMMLLPNKILCLLINSKTVLKKAMISPFDETFLNLYPILFFEVT